MTRKSFKLQEILKDLLFHFNKNEEKILVYPYSHAHTLIYSPSFVERERKEWWG